MQLAEELLAGNRRALARLISMIENDAPEKTAVLQKLYHHTGKAYTIGITGPPGSGKSSLVDRLLHEIRREGLTVGVIAVDPTSPFTGGAILGDRIRMQEHSLDRGIFIRSMGTRGSLGGLSRATRETVQAFDAFGTDIILIETAGVGQSEVDIVKYADTTVVVLTPAGGDSVQTLKAGIMEIADIFVINKADLPGVERTVSAVNLMLNTKIGYRWRPPVITAVSIRHEGIDLLWRSISDHRGHLQESGRIEEVRKERVCRELIEQVEHRVTNRAWEAIKDRVNLEKIVEDIVRHRRDPYQAAGELLESIYYPYESGEGRDV